MSGARLSICIATFNRARFIAETLDSLISELQDGVDIVIVDGASTDSTEAIVTRYASDHPSIRYFRQSINNGIDKDFDRAVDLAGGDYCWLMTDDDLLKPGAVQAVLQRLTAEPGLVIVNAEVWNGDFSKKLEERRLPFDSDRVYEPARFSQLFADTGSYLSFIGCVVIKKSLWMSRRREPYFGSLFIHFGVIFQQPLPGDVIVIAQPYLSIRYGVAMWQPRAFEIWMFKWPQLVWSFDGPTADAKAAVTPQEPWRYSSALVFYRARGTYSLSAYRQWIRPRLQSPWRRFVAGTIAVAPGPLLNALVLVYVRAFYRGSSQQIALLDTKNSRYYLGKWLAPLFAGRQP